VPGVVLALALAFVGDRLAHWLGTAVLGFTQGSPVSPVPVAVLLGLLVRNTVGVPKACEPGLKFCLRTLLRFGIVLLGLKLSLAKVGEVGLAALPIILACIAVALVTVTWVNRALGLPRRLGTLIAVGTSICGVSAIVATAPVIQAEDDEVSYAVACVTVFGLMALFCYPFVAHGLFGDAPVHAGVFLGTAIHDTAQVAGAGLIYQQQFTAPDALSAATVTKLVRNLCMAGVIPLLAVLYHRRASGPGSAAARWHQAVPLFVLFFVLMAAVRTVGDMGAQPFGMLSTETWKQGVLPLAETISVWCLTVAMAAVGLGTELAKLKNLGLRPFGVGLAAALLVGGVSWGLLTVLGRLGWV
jgi:uncharacterized integral membrane protein (TIGR00698 family)